MNSTDDDFSQIRKKKKCKNTWIYLKFAMKSERCVNENRSKEQNNLQKQSAKAKIKPDATC